MAYNILYTTPYGDVFDKAFSELMAVEGIVITNDPDDPGGLTVCGIARKYNPKWSGWKEIDKGLANGTITLKRKLPREYIESVISRFYYDEYWKKLDLNDVNPDVANEVFEQAVNLGTATTVKNLQEVLNTLNYDAATRKAKTADLVVDGKYGPKTRELFVKYSKTQPKFMVISLNCKQGSHYLSLASKSVTKRKYVKGWILNRISM